MSQLPIIDSYATIAWLSENMLQTLIIGNTNHWKHLSMLTSLKNGNAGHL